MTELKADESINESAKLRHMLGVSLEARTEKETHTHTQNEADVIFSDLINVASTDGRNRKNEQKFLSISFLEAR